jgi:hypothetical protein
MLYAKLQDRWNAIRFLRRGRRMRDTAAAPARPPLDLRPALDRFRHELESFILIARQCGIRVVLPAPVHVSGADLLTEPDSATRIRWEVAVPFASPEEVLEGFRAYGQVLRDVSIELQVPFIATDKFGLAGGEWYSEGDPIHFNDRGADRMAIKLASALVDAGMLESPQQ